MVHGKGYCHACYERVRISGDPNRPPRQPRKCKVKGCDRPHYGHGWCEAHYRRWYQHGHLRLVRRLTAIERFNSYVSKAEKLPGSAKPVPHVGGCWEWTGSRSFQSGRFHYEGQYVYAHRFAWTIEHGPIPAGMFVVQTCRNRLCVRPEHLVLMTRKDSFARMLADGRRGWVQQQNYLAKQRKLGTTDPRRLSS